MLTDTESAYLAGFFDGDGCVNISSRKGQAHYLQVVFSQCNRQFLDDWCGKVGKGSVHKNSGFTDGSHKKELWHWRLSDRQAESVLIMMLPYLELKAEQATIAIQFMGTKKRYGRAGVPAHILEQREQFKLALSALKN